MFVLKQSEMAFKNFYIHSGNLPTGFGFYKFI